MCSASARSGRISRLFKLNRLWALEISNSSFTPREIPADRLDLGSSHDDTNEVTIVFDPCVRYRLIEDYGFKSFTETDDGKLLFKIGYTNRDYILTWILGFGDKAKIVVPRSLAEEVKQIALNTAAHYN